MVVAIAVDRTVRVAVRTAAGGFRVRSGDRSAFRARLDDPPQGDIADRVVAAACALRDAGFAVPPFETDVTATLPEAAGLASSAALMCATIAALLRLSGATLQGDALAALALQAERDLLGLPVGPLDQLTVVLAPAHGALLIDCARLSTTPLPWPWDDVVLGVCATGEQHDVGGEGYRSRRAEVERALRNGRTSPRLRHVEAETERSREAADALRSEDAPRLGALMSASHRSLRDLMAVSTPLLDRVVEAATAVDGVLGARLVGAGFGGSVVALTRRRALAACLAAMTRAAGPSVRGAWQVVPSPGLAVTHPDVAGSG